MHIHTCTFIHSTLRNGAAVTYHNNNLNVLVLEASRDGTVVFVFCVCVLCELASNNSPFSNLFLIDVFKI